MNHPKPYAITFDDWADGGPEHLLELLKDYNVMLLLRNAPVVSGRIDSVDDGHVEISPWCDQCRDFSATTKRFGIFDGTFDEVRYL